MRRTENAPARLGGNGAESSKKPAAGITMMGTVTANARSAWVRTHRLAVAAPGKREDKPEQPEVGVIHGVRWVNTRTVEFDVELSADSCGNSPGRNESFSVDVQALEYK